MAQFAGDKRPDVVSLIVRCWTDDQHWRQRLDEATTHVTGQTVCAAQEDGCVGIVAVIHVSRPKPFV